MTLRTRIVIDPVPTPNKPTDGYRFVRHDTTPDWEILDATWMILRKFLKLIGEATDSITTIEASFAQLPSPGELELVIQLELVIPESSPISLRWTYYYISAPHMRTAEAIETHLLERMRNELAEALSAKASRLLGYSADIEKLIGYTGPPKYGDLY